MTDTNATTETETAAETEARRGRGRPTNAELDAREADLKRREDELAAAQANLDMRTADLGKVAPEAVTAARSGEARTGDMRSHPVTEPARGRRYRAGDLAMESRQFFIPPEDIPAGMSYQWNNAAVFGKEDHAYNSFMSMQGWTAVPAERHPHLMPPGHKGPIVVGGQILVERPIELTREAQQEDYERAIGEVRLKEEQLYGPAPKGQFDRQRANGDRTGMVQVGRSIEPGIAPGPYQYENATGPAIE